MVRRVCGKSNQKLTATAMENSASEVSFQKFLWIGSNLVEKWNYSGIADNASITPIMLSRVTSFSSSATLKLSVPAGRSGKTI